MVTPHELYNTMLKDLGRQLAPLGFRRTGANFRKQTEQCYGVINLQKSSYGTRDEISFTVNLGISSKLTMPLQELDPTKPPPVSSCEWRERIGFLLPDQSDKWWEFHDEISFRQILPEVTTAIIHLAAPRISHHLSDEGLQLLWREPRYSWASYSAQRHLCLMLARDGNHPQALDQLEAHISDTPIPS